MDYMLEPPDPGPEADPQEVKGELREHLAEGGTWHGQDREWDMVDLMEILTDDLHDKLQAAAMAYTEKPMDQGAQRAVLGVLDDALDLLAEKCADDYPFQRQAEEARGEAQIDAYLARQERDW